MQVDRAQALIDTLRSAECERNDRRVKNIFWSIHPSLERMIQAVAPGLCVDTE